MEIWKDILGYEGIYQVSNYGNIKSVKRNALMALGKSAGYYSLSLYKNNLAKPSKVHSIVANHFLDKPKTEGKLCINHKDGNKLNNHVDNLEWVTFRENALHKFNVLKCKPTNLGKFGKQHNRSKIICQFTKENIFVKEYYSSYEIQRELGICQSNIIACLKGKRKFAGGFIWKEKIENI